MDPYKQNRGLSLSLINVISFNNIDVSYVQKNKRQIRVWLKTVIENEQSKIWNIDYNFCSDKHLIKINKKYLNHDDYTDIITFDLSDGNEILGDIYISIDRVKENARKIRVNFSDEILRIIVHGVLHLCGYKDKSKKAAAIMRNKENHYLSLLKEIPNFT